MYVHFLSISLEGVIKEKENFEIKRERKNTRRHVRQKERNWSSCSEDSFFMVTEETSSRFLTFFTASVKLPVYRVAYIQACSNTCVYERVCVCVCVCLTASGAQKHGFFRDSAVSRTISSPCFFNSRQEQDQRKFRVYFTSRNANGVPLYYSGSAAPPVSGTVSKVLSFSASSLIHLSAGFAYSFFPFRST